MARAINDMIHISSVRKIAQKEQSLPDAHFVDASIILIADRDTHTDWQTRGYDSFCSVMSSKWIVNRTINLVAVS